MNELWNIIQHSNMDIRAFAEYTHMPLYRIAKILYGQSNLDDDERLKLQHSFGEDIFLHPTKRNV